MEVSYWNKCALHSTVYYSKNLKVLHKYFLNTSQYSFRSRLCTFELLNEFVSCQKCVNTIDKNESSSLEAKLNNSSLWVAFFQEPITYLNFHHWVPDIFPCRHPTWKQLVLIKQKCLSQFWVKQLFFCVSKHRSMLPLNYWSRCRLEDKMYHGHMFQ